MSSTRRTLLAALGALPLAGCTRGCGVRLSGTPDALDITFVDPSPLAFGRLLEFPGSLNVYDLANGKSLWTINVRHVGEAASSGQRLRYGQAPVGAWEKAPPTALERGVGYAVQVSGDGRYGGVCFAFLKEGLVQIEGTGDAPVAALLERVKRDHSKF